MDTKEGDYYLFEKRMELKVNLALQKMKEQMDSLSKELSDVKGELMEARRSARAPPVMPSASPPVMNVQPAEPQFDATQGVTGAMLAQQWANQPQPAAYAAPQNPAPQVMQQPVQQRPQDPPVPDLQKMFYFGGKR